MRADILNAMYWNRLFIPTLRESPAGTQTTGSRLMLRAGYVRQAGGRLAYLSLGSRSLKKTEAMIREEMGGIGGQEVQVGGVREAAVLARELRSYKQLPQVWFEFYGASAHGYSFDAGPDALNVAFTKFADAERRVLNRCGIEWRELATGARLDFVALGDTGDVHFAECPSCGYAARLEYATTRASAPLIDDPAGDLAPQPFHTPGRKTIADVAQFTGLPATSQMKSLAMVADGELVLALVRGDHSLSEASLAQLLDAVDLRPASSQEIRDAFGAEAGSLGPVGVKGMRVLADLALQGRRNMIAGANRDDYHLRNVTPGEDFTPEFFNIRQVDEGEACGGCGAALKGRRAMELGFLRKFGDSFSQRMDLHVTDQGGAEVRPGVEAYGMRIEAILHAIVEQSNDKDGMILPPSVAPFEVVITPVNVKDAIVNEAAQSIYTACRDSGIDALLDDRDERPGVKFKDADLIGVPYRVTVGKKVGQGIVEVVNRRTRAVSDVAINEVVGALRHS